MRSSMLFASRRYRERDSRRTAAEATTHATHYRRDAICVPLNQYRHVSFLGWRYAGSRGLHLRPAILDEVDLRRKAKHGRRLI